MKRERIQKPKAEKRDYEVLPILIFNKGVKAPKSPGQRPKKVT